MNEPELSTVFPEINDPEWIKEREECWALALVKGDWKSEYRKKDLEKIRHFFFTGEMLDGFPFPEQWLRLLKLFPIQTKAGYDYYYKTHKFTPEQLKSNINSALVDQSSSGMRLKEQLAYWEYHLGLDFSSERKITTNASEIVVSLDFKSIGNTLGAKMAGYLERGIGSEKLFFLFDYFLSVFDQSDYDAIQTEDSLTMWNYMFEDIYVLSKVKDLEDYRARLANRFVDEFSKGGESSFPKWIVDKWQEYKVSN